MTRGLLLTLLLLSGCAAPRQQRTATPAPEVSSRILKERYWAEQRAQRPEPAPDFEWLELHRPERTEDGVIRTDSTEYLRIPRSP